MSAIARTRYLRVTPQKARMVAQLIRGRKVQDALNKLAYSTRHVSRDFHKLIRSALANAEQKGGMDPDNLIVKIVTVDQGPTMKRWRARARGMASRIQKKTSHITVVLEEK